MPGVQSLGEIRCLLGEGPQWSVADNALYWVDIQGRRLHRYTPADDPAAAADPGAGAVTTWELPARVGCLALRARGGLLVALEDGIYAFDQDSGAVQRVATPPRIRPGYRFNDGTVDPLGRFWAGTMDNEEVGADGELYRFDPDGTVTTVLTGLKVSNGIGFSPDGRTMYHTDSGHREISAYDFDPASGQLSGRRLFAADTDCFPDGLAVDAEGYVWSAKWDGWRVVRYAPDGRVDRVVHLPVQRPTSLTFGGPDLDRLYVTSARIWLDEAALRRGPLAGAVLVLDEPGAVGRPAHLTLR